MRSVRFALVTMGLLVGICGGAEAQQTSPIPLERMTVQGAASGEYFDPGAR